jgi:glycosyltransferase involved in cell wall biosynthesis
MRGNFLVERSTSTHIEVSTVIPTHRRPFQLAEAIQSALDQNVRGEIIVVDDCPDGSARAVAERFSGAVRYLRREPPSGGNPAMVRNSGWPLARGIYVHFLDDDDRVAAGFHSMAIKRFEANPALGVVFGHVRPFAADGRADMTHERAYFAAASRRARLAAKLRSRYWLAANLLFNATLLVNSACMIRREFIAGLDGYRTDLGLNEDVDFYCRAIRRHGFEFIDTDAVHYRINPHSLMHGRDDDRKLVDTYRKMHRRHADRHGRLELAAMKLIARTLGRLL